MPTNHDSHRMDRRSWQNKYNRPGTYHITNKVNEALYQPLGFIVGDINKADGDADAPHVELSETGQMVEEELTHSITHHYPFIEVQENIVMPDHLHFILVAHQSIISANGRETHLGQVIAGFKKGCNRRYWEIAGKQGEESLRGEPAATTTTPNQHPPANRAGDTSYNSAGGNNNSNNNTSNNSAGGTNNANGNSNYSAGGTNNNSAGGTSNNSAGGNNNNNTNAGVNSGSNNSVPNSNNAHTSGTPNTAPLCLAVHPQEKRTPSNGTTGRPPLFSSGYVDVMPLREGQLEQQRRYILNNPRSRLLRTTNRKWLQTQRASVPTLLSLNALKGYLQRECPPSQFNEAIWQGMQPLLLSAEGMVTCDSYGNTELLKAKLLPVVCHRKDASSFHLQKQRCLGEATNGAVLVSARIAKGEQAIMDAAISKGKPVILVSDNGYPELYHPSERIINLCAQGQMLLVTPWHYHYLHTDEHISVSMCKAMNCVVQSICRLHDGWWKEKVQ